MSDEFRHAWLRILEELHHDKHRVFLSEVAELHDVIGNRTVRIATSPEHLAHVELIAGVLTIAAANALGIEEIELLVLPILHAPEVV